MSDNESDDELLELVAPLPPPGPGVDEAVRAHQAPSGMFSMPDSTKLVLPAQLAAGDKRSAAALSNTVVIFDALQQLVRELGPALKKLRPNVSDPGLGASHVTAREYKVKFLEAEQLWFARLVLEHKTTRELWKKTLDVKEKKSVVMAFMLQNKIVGAGVETIFRQTLNKFATNKKLVLKNAICSAVVSLSDVQKKVPLLLPFSDLSLSLLNIGQPGLHN
jgi:hypothetical protein